MKKTFVSLLMVSMLTLVGCAGPSKVRESLSGIRTITVSQAVEMPKAFHLSGLVLEDQFGRVDPGDGRTVLRARGLNFEGMLIEAAEKRVQQLRGLNDGGSPAVMHLDVIAYGLRKGWGGSAAPSIRINVRLTMNKETVWEKEGWTHTFLVVQNSVPLTDTRSPGAWKELFNAGIDQALREVFDSLESDLKAQAIKADAKKSS